MMGAPEARAMPMHRGRATRKTTSEAGTSLASTVLNEPEGPVFCSLDVLSELGLVERLDLPTGEHAFVACEPAHHHHVVCSRCGRATGIADLGFDGMAASVERATGYRVDTHRLELFGLCPDCQDASAPRRRGAG